jgi:hypothetical protein
LRWASDLVDRVGEIDDDRYEFEHCRDWDEDVWPCGGALEEWLTHATQRMLGSGFAQRLHLPHAAVRPSGPVPTQPMLAREGLEARIGAHFSMLMQASLEALRCDDPELVALRELADRIGCKVTSIAALLLVRPFWLRPLEQWSGRSLASLVEHLLVAYPAPRFLLQAWSPWPSVEALRWMAWLIVLGQGGSLSRMSELTHARDAEQWACVPSKLAAALARVPDSLPPRHGVMLAEILRLGGSEREFELLRRDPSYVHDFSGPLETDELAFWRGTVAWLIRCRSEVERERDATVAVLAWARHEQTERARRGQTFEWRGRTWASACRDALAYQQSVRHPWLRHLQWRRRGWDWQVEHEGAAWTIRELCSSAALREESQAMAHCVHGYDLACSRGGSAIFGLCRDGLRCVTIELRPSDRCVVQVKRARNQAPSPLELDIIARWLAHLRAS